MAEGKADPGWGNVLRVMWRAFAAPARTFAAKFCKFWIVAGCVFLLLEMLAPDVGESYLSFRHVADIADAAVDVMVWYLALWFVRERDEARAELKARITTS